MIRSIDHHDCLLRYLCELESLRKKAEETGDILNPELAENLILLKVAKYDNNNKIILFRFRHFLAP